MSEINWQLAQEKLIPGLRVRGGEALSDYDDSDSIFSIGNLIRARVGKEGILIRYGIESLDSNYLDASIVLFFDDPREWNFEASELEYFIDNRWQTFDEVMK